MLGWIEKPNLWAVSANRCIETRKIEIVEEGVKKWGDGCTKSTGGT